MAILSLIYGNKRKLKIATIDVDVSISESHETDCDISENPVESGANITDHVQLLPSKITIEGLISDTPISLIGQVTSFFDDNRSRKVYDELLAIQQAREPIELVTGLKMYTNMILKTLTVPRNSDTGKAVKFTAIFQEVFIVESQEISLDVANSKYAKKTEIGKTTTTTPTTSDTDVVGSILSRITGLGA